VLSSEPARAETDLKISPRYCAVPGEKSADDGEKVFRAVQQSLTTRAGLFTNFTRLLDQ
jgi:hypothetical protein